MRADTISSPHRGHAARQHIYQTSVERARVKHQRHLPHNRMDRRANPCQRDAGNTGASAKLGVGDCEAYLCVFIYSPHSVQAIVAHTNAFGQNRSQSFEQFVCLLSMDASKSNTPPVSRPRNFHPNCLLARNIV